MENFQLELEKKKKLRNILKLIKLMNKWMCFYDLVLWYITWSLGYFRIDTGLRVCICNNAHHGDTQCSNLAGEKNLYFMINKVEL